MHVEHVWHPEPVAGEYTGNSERRIELENEIRIESFYLALELVFSEHVVQQLPGSMGNPLSRALSFPAWCRHRLRTPEQIIEQRRSGNANNRSAEPVRVYIGRRKHYDLVSGALKRVYEAPEMRGRTIVLRERDAPIRTQV
jgi:hypothetical protein